MRQKNNASLLCRITKKMKGNEAGVTLIETLAALAILGLIAVALLSGVVTGARATFIADERATAESLARSQMEYVKSLDYAASYTLAGLPEGGGWAVPAPLVEPVPGGEDQGIQKITITVKHGDKTVLTVEGYKAER